MSNFSRAGRAEILRAAQKDDEFCNVLKIQLSDFVGDVVGQRLWISRYNLLEHLTCFLYQTCTTMRNLQTLGEEYTGIVQVDSSGRHLPSKLRFATSIILDSGGPLLIHGIVLMCERALRQQNIPQETREKLKKFITVAKVSAPFLQHFHKTLFYLHGDYYHFAKRCTGIHYVLFRSWLKDRDSRKAFHWLGIVSAIYLALSVLHSIYNNQLWTKDLSGASVQAASSTSCSDPTLRCSLCLETRTSSSCTPCGHIFCWACIHEWLSTKNECPLCRELVVPSRVIRLQNYDKIQVANSGFV